MSDFTQNFSAAFEKAARREKGFTASHQQQLDLLQQFCEELNAEGVFSAAVENVLDKPCLVIKKREVEVSFNISYGFAPFSGSATVKLSHGLNDALVGEKGIGYDLRFDAKKFSAALGEVVAKKMHQLQLDAETRSYIAQKKPSSP